MKNFSRVTNGIFMCLSMVMFSSFMSAMDWEEDANAELLYAMNGMVSIRSTAMDRFSRIVRAIKNGADINLKNKNGLTPVHLLLLTEYGWVDKKERSKFFESKIKPILDEYQPDLTKQTNNGDTPLLVAVRTENKETIGDIAKREPRNKNIFNGFNETPLTLAISLGLSEDILNLLK
jgi:hypothetical protein